MPPSFASWLLATGRAAAQAEELAFQRRQNTTMSNDARMNNVKLGASGAAAERMGLLQFASIVQQTMQEAAAGDTKDEAGAPAAAKPFDAAAVMTAFAGASSHARLGYGGEEGAQAWARHEKKRKKKHKKEKKEMKRKKKDKREKQKLKKKAKISKLVEEKGMEYADAKNAVEAILSSGSGSDSDSDSSEVSSSS